MKSKTMLLAAAALSALAFAALPSMAMASHQPPTSGLPENAAFSGTTTNTATLYGAQKIVCKTTAEQPNTVTTSGKFETPHTGSVKFTFHNCREATLNSTCTTAGEPSGTITTTTLPFHLLYLEPKAEGETHERPGALITPKEGHFATFSCLGGLVKVVVGGTGVLGTVTKPGIGGKSHSFSLKVKATAEGQEHTTTHTTETYGLTASINGGEAKPAYEDAGEAEAIFNGEGVEGTTTTQT